MRVSFSVFLIARANLWDDARKSMTLAVSLKGKARAVLESVENLDNMNFEELKLKLELRFEEGNLAQNYYFQFTNCRQKSGENFASFGAEFKRLSCLAYSEYSFSIRDKIACAQFVSALTNEIVGKTPQFEGSTSLKAAVERAKTVKIIQERNFENKFKFENSVENIIMILKEKRNVVCMKKRKRE